MPVGANKTTNYYSLSKEVPKVRHKTQDGRELFFDYIEGLLTRIDHVEDEYQGRKVYKFMFHFEPSDHSYKDILQVGENSSAARGILMSLYNVKGPIQHVKVAPYHKEHNGRNYTNVWFEHNGETVDWDKSITSKVPPVRTINAGGREMKDDADRIDFFRRMANQIKQRLAAGAVPGHSVDPETGEIYQPSPQQAEPTKQQRKPANVTPMPTNKIDGDTDLYDDDDLPF